MSPPLSRRAAVLNWEISETIHMESQTRPIIIFDTSVVNKFEQSPEFTTLLAGLKAAYFVRVPETVIAEIVASKDSGLRLRLFNAARRLRSVGEAIRPFNHIVQDSIRLFEKDPSAFDWRRIPVSMPKIEELLDRITPDDKISAVQRKQAKDLAKQFNATFSKMKAPFDDYFIHGKINSDIPGASEIPIVPERPSLEDMLTSFRREGGSMWIWGGMLYKKDDPSPTTEETIRRFYDVCPPFRALLVAMVTSQYERCIRDEKTSESLRAGRVDTYMSAYLPYCSRFVTDDPRQINLLKNVVTYADLPESSVVSYSDFVKTHLPDFKQ
jgi:hypothetical protein